ncbi:calcium-responsive transactivator-like isoform X1 [Acropora muricata]|uniref:calcium-responsive transactivator-like isoform X1 n=1 Tax=Acropora muricata TaxID=159855 RepID=UPI0010FC8D7A
MSMTFVSGRQRQEATQQTVQSLLDENSQLIQAIVDYQSKGKAYECTQYQQLLHRNLVYLATLADSSQSMQNTIPAPGSQSGTSMKTPPTSVTPPSASGMLQQGLSDMTSSSGTSSSDIMSNTPGINSGIPSAMNDPLKSSMPSQLGGMSGPTTAGYGGSSVSGIGQSTPSPPQLQHPPMTAQSHMGYPNPSQSQQGRPIAPHTMSSPMGNLPPQVPVQSHAPPMSQHIMSQNQQQSQQYLMQQRQMQYRQGAAQQMPQQQQSMSHGHPAYGPTASGGMPSGTMIPGYAAQQQSQRYNPYRQPPQQQGLSHMPYPTQQQPSSMQGQSVMGQQPQMGQAPVGQAPMQQPPMV